MKSVPNAGWRISRYSHRCSNQFWGARSQRSRHRGPGGESERIVRAVEVKPLPKIPPHIRGFVNAQGPVLPVVDLRVRLGQKPWPVALGDHFVIARTKDLSVILPVDAALGSRTVSGGSTPASGCR